eukprot:g56316.t1
MAQVVIVGGGLSGLSAAHTVLQAGGRVVLLDKKAFLGGNSTKATSGMNGAGTSVQKKQGVEDSAAIFHEDTIRGGTGAYTGPMPEGWPLAKVITYESGPAVEWLMGGPFNLPLDTVSRLGGHSRPRTHRSKSGGKFPGMMITYKLMQEMEAMCVTNPERCRIITKAQVTKLLADNDGAVVGVEYKRDGKTYCEPGAVVVSTGGYGAGVLDTNSVLSKLRPDIMSLPTTNGDPCTGDAIDFVSAVGGEMVDLKEVQVHPTGLVHPNFPNDKIKFLAAEALRGEGGLLIDKEGRRFCNNLGTRDYVSGRMMAHNKGPYRLVLNSEASSKIDWHCKHYTGRKVMVKQTGGELCKDLGIPESQLQQTFDEYNKARRGEIKDKHGLKYFSSKDVNVNDSFHVAIVTPVVHYCMGGVKIDTNSQVVGTNGKPIPGLWAAGEVAGGVHAKNRLGGSALLECVVFGRVAGRNAAKLKT